MKYPLTVGTIAILALVGLVKVVHNIATAEQCDVAVSYSLPTKNNPVDMTRMIASTRAFADSRGYKFMNSVLDGKLTLYGAEDEDRLVIILNRSQPKVLKVSFYDCRKGGNGSATGEAWMRTIGARHLKQASP